VHTRNGALCCHSEGDRTSCEPGTTMQFSFYSLTDADVVRANNDDALGGAAMSALS